MVNGQHSYTSGGRASRGSRLARRSGAVRSPRLRGYRDRRRAHRGRDHVGLQQVRFPGVRARAGPGWIPRACVVRRGLAWGPALSRLPLFAVRDRILEAGPPPAGYSPTQRLVALAIADHMGDKAEAYPSRRALEAWTGLGHTAVVEALRVLCPGESDPPSGPKALFKRTRGGALKGSRYTANTYQLLGREVEDGREADTLDGEEGEADGPEGAATRTAWRGPLGVGGRQAHARGPRDGYQGAATRTPGVRQAVSQGLIEGLMEGPIEGRAPEGSATRPPQADEAERRRMEKATELVMACDEISRRSKRETGARTVRAQDVVRWVSTIPASNGHAAKSFDEPRSRAISIEWIEASLSRVPAAEGYFLRVRL